MTTGSPSPATMRLYTEDEGGSTVALITRRHRLYQQRFLTMFETSTEMLSQWDRPSVYWRVLHLLLSRLDPVQYRRLSAAEIVTATGISKASSERALAMLEADQIIFCRGKTGAKARRLNNRLCWKSNSDKWNEVSPDPMPEDARGR